MSKMISNKAASVLAKLKAVAKREGVDFNVLGTRYVQERFLYRLSISPYQNFFILKGGLLLFALSGLGTRPTRDMDVLAKGINNDADHMTDVFRCICDIEAADGVIYHSATVEVAPIQDDDKYMGLRVRFVATIERSRYSMQVDIGFGDVVVPDAQQITYPVLLMEEAPPIIMAYSEESVIAEKFEAMIDLGGLNSRMKDFYDIWKLSTRYRFDGNLLKEAVLETIKNRGTDIHKGNMLFTPEFITAEKELQWRSFLQRNKLMTPLTMFADIMGVLRNFLHPVFHACTEGSAFSKVWLPTQAQWCDPIAAIRDTE